MRISEPIWPSRLSDAPPGYIAHAAREALTDLDPGEGVQIRLPEDGYQRRELYRRIAAVAYALWGSGSYTLRGLGQDQMIVTRLKMRSGT